MLLYLGAEAAGRVHQDFCGVDIAQDLHVLAAVRVMVDHAILSEVGILIRVHYQPRGSAEAFLIIDLDGEPFVGTLAFDDGHLVAELAQFLKSKIGRSIKEIGDLEFS